MDYDKNQAARYRISQIYNPSTFSEYGSQVVLALSDYLSKVQDDAARVLNWNEPPRNIEEAATYLDNKTNIDAILKAVLSKSQNIHCPKYMGHQVAPPLPVAALLEAVSATLNQGMTVYEMGPWSSAIERLMIQRIGEELGMMPGYGGIVTHGGSMANLTALLAARSRSQSNIWQQGAHGESVVLVSSEGHYSVQRAAGIIGLGTHNCISVAVDENFKMDIGELQKAIDSCLSNGKTVMAVVASATSTRTGTYDPIRKIGNICGQYGIWFHVDGAHGASACFSDAYRDYLDGIELADSVSIDAHKMLYMPALSTYLIYKNGKDQYLPFNQNATYLFEQTCDNEQQYDTGLGTIECTKRAASLSLWGAWALYGKKIFRDLVNVTFSMARAAADKFQSDPCFELINYPESNVIVFRYLPEGVTFNSEADKGRFQRELRKALIQSGDIYIVPAEDRGVSALRLVIMNPLTEERHLEILKESLKKHANIILNQKQNL